MLKRLFCRCFCLATSAFPAELKLAEPQQVRNFCHGSIWWTGGPSIAVFGVKNPNSWNNIWGSTWGYIDTWTIMDPSPKCSKDSKVSDFLWPPVARRPHANVATSKLCTTATEHLAVAPLQKVSTTSCPAVAQYGTPWIGGRGLASAWPQMRKVMRLKQSCFFKKKHCAAERNSP